MEPCTRKYAVEPTDRVGFANRAISSINSALEENSKFWQKLFQLSPEEAVELVQHPGQIYLPVESCLDPETRDWKSPRHEEQFELSAVRILNRLPDQRKKASIDSKTKCWNCGFSHLGKQVAGMCRDCWNDPNSIYDEDEDYEGRLDSLEWESLIESGFLPPETPALLEVDGIVYTPTQYHLKMFSLK